MDSSKNLLFLATLIGLNYVTATTPALQIPFNNTRGYGPDGPWHFVTLSIGLPSQQIDFYPAIGSIETRVQVKSSCGSGSAACLTPTPGMYDTMLSSTSRKLGLDESWINVVNWLPADKGTGHNNLTGGGLWGLDQIDTPLQAQNLSLYLGYNITTSAPCGKSYVPLSLLSLEAINHTQPIPNAIAPYSYEYTLLQAYIESHPDASSTFGMHMGSPSFDQDGSLYLGGYDQSRLIEPPATFDIADQVSVRSISIGTSSGISPFDSTLNPNASTPPNNLLNGTIKVYISPATPHLELPRSICTSLQQYLPISLNQSLGLWTWNTNQQSYKEIISSPTYLNFTLGDEASTSIRVPFSLLNLTLTAPLVDSPTLYFPCSPVDDENYVLGRAFLQAAFFAQDFNQQKIILGQAPGPTQNVTNPVTVPIKGSFAPSAKAPEWEDTWHGVLIPLSSQNVTSRKAVEGNPLRSGSANSVLSSGAIAGICIAAITIPCLIISGTAYSIIQRKKAALEDASGHALRTVSRPGSYSDGVRTVEGGKGGFVKYEMARSEERPPAKLAGDHDRVAERDASKSNIVPAAGPEAEGKPQAPPIPNDDNEPVEIMDKHYSMSWGKFRPVQWGPLD